MSNIPVITRFEKKNVIDPTTKIFWMMMFSFFCLFFCWISTKWTTFQKNSLKFCTVSNWDVEMTNNPTMISTYIWKFCRYYANDKPVASRKNERNLTILFLYTLTQTYLVVRLDHPDCFNFSRSLIMRVCDVITAKTWLC